MIKIKVCGMLDVINVKEVGETRPDFMGFIFYPLSPRFVGPEPEPELFRSVPAGIQKTGVFVDEKIEKILEMALLTGLDFIQLHGNESVEYCRRLQSSGLRLIKAFSVTEFTDFEALNLFTSVCDYFLFDTKSETFGGSGKKFNWDLLNRNQIEKQFFLSGGIGPGDIQELSRIENNNFFAVDLNSRFEDSPGIKNIDLLQKFIYDFKIRRI